MARPTAFDRQTSFTQFSSNYPAKPQNGASLDSEFNAVKIALDETQSNLALIQDDDGKLARGSVGRAQFDSSITLGFETPTPWAADTSYTADLSTIFYQAKFYSCIETHVSADTFDATKWFEIADLSASAAIDDGSITEAKLASNAVSADKIAPLAVTTPKLASQAVTNPKLADGAVTRAKVADSAGPDLAALILPAGLGPIPWSLAGNAPAGWVFDGGTYLRADYPALAALAVADAANTSSWFTVGDGSTTFTIKSAAGRALVGVDATGAVLGSALTLGGTTGSKDHTLTRDELPAEAPAFNGELKTGWSGTSVGSTWVKAGAVNGISTSAGSSAKALTSDAEVAAIEVTLPDYRPLGTIENLGSGDAHPIVQPVVAVRFIFKAH